MNTTNKKRALPSSKTRSVTILALGLCLSSAVAFGKSNDFQPEELANFSLEELLNVRVVSVDTDLRQLTGEAAAIHVIEGDLIRRSGYRALAEVLRLAPGMHVGAINKNDWAISSRGMNGDFADKMEVLLDGRRLQTPLFLGVQWNLQDTMLADIERIEVIRGPGGALWGTNAVNGVINIVTRSAIDTHGHYAEFGAGNEETVFGDYRYGDVTDNDMHYRIWGKGWNRSQDKNANGDEFADNRYRYQTGFRLDWGNPEESLFNLQGSGNYHDNDTVDNVFEPGLAGTRPNPVVDEFYGANLVFRWTKKIDETSDFQLSTYYDLVVRDTPLLGDHRNSVDLTLKHNFSWGSRHQITWGGGYRASKDRVQNSFTVQVNPSEETLSVWQFFAQDRIVLMEDKLSMTIGSKFEYNDFTGFEAQPSLRFLLKATESQTLWAAVSRAVRTPSRLDTGVRFVAAQSGPAFVAVFGDPEFESEELVAWEFGYRAGITSDFSIDIATFYNDYDKLRTFQLGNLTFIDGVPFVPLNIGNLNSAKTWGAELSATWQPKRELTVRGGYSYFGIDVDEDPAEFPSDINVREDEDPEHQFFIHAAWDVAPDIQFDGMLRYVDDLTGVDTDVPSYAELDLRWAWQFSRDWKFALVGKNLIHDQRQQYQSEIFGGGAFFDRSVFVQFSWEPRG